jgi:hypothetical protein
VNSFGLAYNFIEPCKLFLKLFYKISETFFELPEHFSQLCELFKPREHFLQLSN